ALAAQPSAESSSDALIGKWKADYEMEGEAFRVVYEFTLANGQLVGYARSMQDARDEESTNTLVMDNIVFLDGRGTANYSIDYEGERYEVEATLELTRPDRLTVRYSYYGYAEEEVWHKMK
ncbi:MAG TPA: hypothetical protein DCR93_13405, partial [Cytophagales bacterium]|nr:hypothetical protein [Cytophagales bacterium]